MKVSEIMVLNHIGTKKEVKKLIKKGHVFLDDIVITEDINIDDGILIIKGKSLDILPLHYYMINKPIGYVCANRDEHDPCFIDIIGEKDLHYIGRLDRDTTGLVLMTNHLKLRKRLILPEYQIPRTYMFESINKVTFKDIEVLSNGIHYNHGDIALPAYVEMIDDTKGYITLNEGKYHEIKKMFLSLGNKILSLHRVTYGPIKLGDLKLGDYRKLSKDEVIALLEAVGL